MVRFPQRYLSLLVASLLECSSSFVEMLVLVSRRATSLPPFLVDHLLNPRCSREVSLMVQQFHALVPSCYGTVPRFSWSLLTVAPSQPLLAGVGQSPLPSFLV